VYIGHTAPPLFVLSFSKSVKVSAAYQVIMPKVFLITGTSTGFGNHLVQEVLDKGDIAIATARKPESLKFKGTNEKVITRAKIKRLYAKNRDRTTFLSNLM